MSNTSGTPSLHSKRRTRSPFRSRDSHRLVVLEADSRESYLQRTAEMIGIEFPAEYIARAEVLAVFNQDDILCGGVMLVKRGPFRSIAGIPDEQRARYESLNDQTSVAEINGLWMAPEMKGPFLSFQFWRLLIGYLIDSRKTSFLFTYDNGNSRMKSLAQWLSPTTLYSGTTLPLPGMKSVAEETIARINIEPVKVFLTMLERRGIGTADPEEKKIIARLGNRSNRSGAASF